MGELQVLERELAETRGGKAYAEDEVREAVRYMPKQDARLSVCLLVQSVPHHSTTPLTTKLQHNCRLLAHSSN
jgi:hypothetical protein